MDKNPFVFLFHIKDSIDQIEEYITGYSIESFLEDKKTQDAIIRQLEIIGEATTNLEEAFKKDNTSIPWREIADFRNVLAHEYWDVDLEIVWNAVKKDLPALKSALLVLLKNL